jgi:DNA end-binding protein Ku
MARPLWNGAISWGLVTISVSVVPAIGSGHKTLFHQMHRADHGRVRIRKVCELDNQELTEGDIVRGFESPDGRVATVTDDELADLPLPTAHAVEVHGFLAASDVDPVQLAKPYYLQPGKGAAKAYSLFRDALARSGRAAVTKLAMNGSEKLALIRPNGPVLVLHLLHWPDEVRSPAGLVPSDRVTVTDTEVAAALELMDSIGPADLEAIHDDYQHAVDVLLDAKLAGTEPPTLEQAPAAAPMDLMAALRQSLEDAEARRAKPHAEASAPNAPKRKAAKKAARGREPSRDRG